MSTSKFTPGPWCVSVHEMNEPSKHVALGVWPVKDKIYDGKYWAICSVSPVDLIDEEDLANSRLIASAPDMYALLEDMQHCDTLSPVYVERIKEILKKCNA